MSTAKTHIQAILAAVELLGYTFTDEYFDFDNFPTSGSDNVYRLETATGKISGLTGNRVEKRKKFDIWVAFKLAAASNRKQDVYDVIDAKEAMEDAVLDAVSGIQVNIDENVMSGIKNDYILTKLTGELVYWTDIN
jgi:hypothetical protein